MNPKGFTLVELLIGTCISLVLLAGVVLAHRHQTRTRANLAMSVAVQQNLRAAMYHLEWDLRMAGADFCGTAYAATVPILTAESDRVAFSWDQDRDGCIEPAKEVVEYFLYDSTYMQSRNLQRREDGRSQPVAQHIDAVNFVYFGTNQTVPLTLPLSTDERREVQRVQISLVGRTQTPLKMSRGNGRRVFVNPGGTEILATPSDHYRRIQLNGEVGLRNMPVYP